MSKTWYFSHSRAESDSYCKRKRYLGSEWGGTGLEPVQGGWDLQFGNIIHKYLDKQAMGAGFGFDDVRNAVMLADSNLSDIQKKDYATLAEGLIRGFIKTIWPGWLKEYEIVETEKLRAWEVEKDHVFRFKQDVLLRNRTTGNLVYPDYKTTSSDSPQWVASWTKSPQLHSSMYALEQGYRLKVDHAFVQGFYKGYKDKKTGHLSSIFSRGWVNREYAMSPSYCLIPTTKVLTSDLRWVEVGTLKFGDKLAAFDEEAPIKVNGKRGLRQWKESIVNAVGHQILPCYRLTFSDGTIITCSNLHKWLITKSYKGGSGTARWETTENLETHESAIKRGWFSGSKIFKAVPVWDDIPFGWDTGYLAAAYEGEGSLTQNTKDIVRGTRLTFTQNSNIMLDQVIAILDRYGIKYGISTKSTENKQVNISDRPQVLRILSQVRPKRLLDKLNINTLGSFEADSVQSLIMKEFIGNLEVTTLSTSTKTLIAEGYATHNSYTYKNYKGWEPFYTFDEFDNLANWVNNMPPEILAAQFPRTAPIYPRAEIAETYFRQQMYREREVKGALEKLNSTIGCIDQNKAINEILDEHFPQDFHKCTPAYGFDCEFKDLCWIPYIEADPLGSGLFKQKTLQGEDLRDEQNTIS